MPPSVTCLPFFCNTGLHKFRATGRRCSQISRKFVQPCCNIWSFSSLPEYSNFFIYMVDHKFSRISEFVFLFPFVGEVGSECMYRCLSNPVRISVGPQAVLTGFRNFFSFPAGKFRYITSIRYDRFFPNPLQFMMCHHLRFGLWRGLVIVIASWHTATKNNV